MDVQSLKSLSELSSFQDKARIQQRGRTKSKKACWYRTFRTFRSQGKWSAESDDQPLFEFKQRLLALEIEKDFVCFVLRGNEVWKVTINHFLRASNAYYTSIRTRKASPCTIFNKSKRLLWIGKNEPCSPQKAFAFVEYGTRRCPSSSDRGVAWKLKITLRRNEVRKVNMAMNHFRAEFFWEQATPTSLEIEEINPKQEQAYGSFSGEMKCGNSTWSTTFWEQATPTSLEIEKVSFRLRLRLVLRGNHYLPRELIYKVINSCFRENLVQIYFYFMKRGVFFLCR